MDEPTQQHRQDDPAAGEIVNPFRRGHRVRVHCGALDKWPRYVNRIGYVTEDPGRYTVTVLWLSNPTPQREAEIRKLIEDCPAQAAVNAARQDLFHYCWLEPAPSEEIGGCDGI